MKALLTIVLLASSIMTDGVSVIDNISSALRSGQTNEINQYFANSVDVTILDYQNFLDKGATAKRVSAFFSDKSISGYKIIHEGTSKGKDSVFTIGTLQTDKGNFKVYMFVTSKDGQHFIEEIKIES